MIDSAKILKLCNDIEGTVTELAAKCEIIDREDHEKIMWRLKDIAEELGIPEIEMKPCPFCGGEAYFDFYHDETVSHMSPRIEYRIRCRECGICSPKQFAMQAHFRPDQPEGFDIDTEQRDKAVELWNTRNGGAGDGS